MTCVGTGEGGMGTGAREERNRCREPGSSGASPRARSGAATWWAISLLLVAPLAQVRAARAMQAPQPVRVALLEAGEPGAAAERGRQAHGHFFQLSSRVPDPFVLTRFGSLTGIEYQSGRILLPEGGHDGASAWTLTQGFGLGLALCPWWGLELETAGSVFAAQGRGTATAGGAEGGFSLELASKVVLLESRWVRGALRAMAGYTQDYVLDVQPAIDRLSSRTEAEVNEVLADVVAGRIDASDPRQRGALRARLLQPTLDEMSPANLLARRQLLVAGGGVQAASALHPALGLLGSMDLDYLGQFAEREASSGGGAGAQLVLSTLLSLDLRPVSPLPLGATLLYQHGQTFGLLAAEATRRTFDLLGLGVFYTGRQDLGLGLESTAVFGDSFVGLGTELRLWYYW